MAHFKHYMYVIHACCVIVEPNIVKRCMYKSMQVAK